MPSKRASKPRKRRKKGRIKKGYYKGFKCDSGWELAFIIYCLENGKQIIRNTQKFPYVYRKKKMNWLPDFLVDGQWVEVKGRETAKTFAKYEHFPHPLTILRRADLIDVFKYVETKYGKDYTKLYGTR